MCLDSVVIVVVIVVIIEPLRLHLTQIFIYILKVFPTSIILNFIYNENNNVNICISFFFLGKYQLNTLLKWIGFTIGVHNERGSETEYWHIKGSTYFMLYLFHTCGLLPSCFVILESSSYHMIRYDIGKELTEMMCNEIQWLNRKLIKYSNSSNWFCLPQLRINDMNHIDLFFFYQDRHFILLPTITAKTDSIYQCQVELSEWLLPKTDLYASYFSSYPSPPPTLCAILSD